VNARARILAFSDLHQARRVVQSDPVANVFVASRLDAGVLSPAGQGVVWGWPANPVSSLLHVGANMVPVAASPAAIDAFADVAGPRRTCQSILGPAGQVLGLWRALCQRWGDAYAATREIRPRQPVMAISGAPAYPADPRVRPLAMEDFESYMAASLAMYAEEVGGDPTTQGAAGAYRAHCRFMVEQGRAFGIVEDGRVVFKADVGPASGGVAQMQGVWLEPSLRGHGHSEPAVAATARYMLARYNTVSLYVNDYNVRAARAYAHVGFHVVGEFASVLY